MAGVLVCSTRCRPLRSRSDAVQSCVYAYRYDKTYRFDSDRGELTIGFRLVNTGKRGFSFEHYNHNWFSFDDDPVDRETFMESGFELPALPYPWLIRREARLHPDPARPPSFFAPLFVEVPPERGWGRVVRADTGWGVTVRSDTALSGFALYMTPRAICPELFVTHRVEPGDKAAWELRYRFTPFRDAAAPPG